MRRARNEAGPQLFKADELRAILDALDGNANDAETGERLQADPAMKTMVLLGMNGGLGNTDVADMPRSAIDFADGWLD